MPNVEYKFTRVKSEPPIPNSERLKELGFIIGKWEAKNAEGGSSSWTFKWSADKNLIENEVVMCGPDGEVTYSSKGVLGWDASNRQITNWTFDNQGSPAKFIWVKTGDRTWSTWPTDGNWTATVKTVDQDTWSVDWGAAKSEFKRQAEK